MCTASDRDSYFEQKKLIALDEEEQSRWENETVCASRLKIEDNGKDEPAEPGSQESWQKSVGRSARETGFFHRSHFTGHRYRSQQLFTQTKHVFTVDIH